MDPFADIEAEAYYLALGIRVEDERTRLGLTKEQLAERSGLASRYVWRLEAGRQNVTLKNLVAIALGLDVTVAQLTDRLEALAAAPPPRPPKKPRGPAARASSTRMRTERD